MTLPTRVSWYGRYRGCSWYKKFGKRKKSFREKLRSIFGHQRAKNEGTNTKIDRGPETYPISINPRDEMNRADSFREKLRKPRFSVNEGTNTKIDRGPETYPISINPRDEMNRADSFREKLRKPRFSVNFWPPEGQKWGHKHENRKGSRDLPHKYKSQG